MQSFDISIDVGPNKLFKNSPVAGEFRRPNKVCVTSL